MLPSIPIPSGVIVNSLAAENETSMAKMRVNPFKVPNDNSIFLARSQDKERRRLEQQQQLHLKVHEKLTNVGRIRARQVDLRRHLAKELDEELEGAGQLSHREPVPQDSPVWRLAMMRDRNIGRESMNEYIFKKRELFRLEYALSVKRDEIAQLEEVEKTEENKLMTAEKFLEEDALMFDKFLKENDKNSMEAIKMAEQMTTLKLDKVVEIKRITTKMVSIKSDISKYEDILREYKLYKNFLFKLSPPEWQETQRAKLLQSPTAAAKEKKSKGKEREKSEGKEKEKSEEREREKKSSRPDKRAESNVSNRSQRVPRTHSDTSISQDSRSATSEADNDSSEFEEEPELYFTEPQQLLDLLTDLEEQNLSLIQNSRENEEALEEFKQIMELSRRKMEEEVSQLQQQIETMAGTISREKTKAAELEVRARLFNFGKYEAEEQDRTLETLSSKVEDVYRSCVGDSEACLSTLQMLMAIEGRLGELLENLEIIPRDQLLMAQRAKDKERRMRARDEKLRQQKQHQEERLKKALERAQAEIKRTTGKKLMARSQPPLPKMKLRYTDEEKDREREELLYFFT